MVKKEERGDKMKEKEYRDFSSTAKRGISKFSSLSSSGMKRYGELYKKRTGKSYSHVNNKENFYSFVARNKLRKR